MRSFRFAIAPLIFFLGLSAQAVPRTSFIQLFEWPWQDVARECEIYLGPSGFNAVQVSPPHEHITTPNSPWWERYQVVSYKVNSRGGSEAEFVDMVNRCHRVGVSVYADAVINHAAGFAEGRGFAGSPFKLYDYPGTYSWNDFHHCGRNGNDSIVNFNDLFEMQNCNLVGLADLATGAPYVRGKIAEYLNHLLDLGVDGFRIDAAKHIPPQDIRAITGMLKRPAYIFQEIIYNRSEGIQYGDYTPVGDVTAYGYAYSVGQAFKYKNQDLLYNITRNLPGSQDSVVFLANHDTERNHDLSSLMTYTQDEKLYMLAQVYMLSWPFGYPQLYSGYRFQDYDQGPPLDQNKRTLPVLDGNGQCKAPWTCEHRRPEVAAMIDFRNQTDQAFTLSNYSSNGRDQISYSRGNIGFVAINFSDYQMSQRFNTGLAGGVYCNLVGDKYDARNRTCPLGYKVNDDGTLQATLTPGTAIVLMRPASSVRMK